MVIFIKNCDVKISTVGTTFPQLNTHHSKPETNTTKNKCNEENSHTPFTTLAQPQQKLGKSTSKSKCNDESSPKANAMKKTLKKKQQEHNIPHIHTIMHPQLHNQHSLKTSCPTVLFLPPIC